MLLLLGLATLAGLWWLGRSGWRWPGRLLKGHSLRRLIGYAAFAGAALMGMRGSLLASLALTGLGIWLTEGAHALGRQLGQRASAWTRPRGGGIAFELDAAGVPRDGRILAGPLAGRRLSSVALPELATLWRVAQGADPGVAQGLEAYLDGRFPGWRVDAERDPHPGAGRPLHPGTMTEQEAYQILGLERGASPEAIRAAHRALMKQVHPDRLGEEAAPDPGAGDRAARVNAARDRLLNRHR